MNPGESPTGSQSNPLVNGSGERLRLTREAQQMDAVQVANELRLSVRNIEAIEAEDLTQLPGPSYICGYLRSYAKLMGLPPDEILNNFPGVPEYLASVKSTVMPTQMVVPTEDATRQAPIPGFTPANVGMVLAAGALAVFLIMQLSGKREEAQQVPTPQSSTPTAVQQQPQPSLPQASPEAPTTVAESSPTQPLESNTVTAGQAPAEPVVSPPQKPAAVVTEAETSASANPPAEGASANTSSGSSRLELQFRGESWVEVTDAANKRLAYELVPAGETRELSGVAPFQVTLGAGSEVDIRLNDAMFDMRRYARAKMVNLKIGKSEDNQPQASSN